MKVYLNLTHALTHSATTDGQINIIQLELLHVTTIQIIWSTKINHASVLNSGTLVCHLLHILGQWWSGVQTLAKGEHNITLLVPSCPVLLCIRTMPIHSHHHAICKPFIIPSYCFYDQIQILKVLKWNPNGVSKIKLSLKKWQVIKSLKKRMLIFSPSFLMCTNLILCHISFSFVINILLDLSPPKKCQPTRRGKEKFPEWWKGLWNWVFDSFRFKFQSVKKSETQIICYHICHVPAISTVF